jgi:hypothetical protein
VFLEEMRFRRQLRKIEKEAREVDEEFAKKRADANKNGSSPEDIESMEVDKFNNQKLYAEDMNIMESGFLMQQARRLRIGVPKLEIKGNQPVNGWVEKTVGHGYYLDQQALVALRSEIMKAQREKREGILAYSSVGIAGGGLLVAMLALTLEHSRPITVDVRCTPKTSVAVKQH